MIIHIDTYKEVIHYNGKVIPIKLMDAFAMAPIGTKVEIMERTDDITTVKIYIPNEQD